MIAGYYLYVAGTVTQNQVHAIPLFTPSYIFMYHIVSNTGGPQPTPEGASF